MKKWKSFFKKSARIRRYHKNFKKKLWTVTDFFKLIYFKLFGFPIIYTHYARLNNFGDQFNINLLNFLGYKLMYSKDWSTAEIALTGSILQHYSKKFEGYILGAGFINNKQEYNGTNWNIKIIRGPLSLKQSGNNENGILFGDPGILANLIFCESKSIKKYKLGIVPHYVDYDFVNSNFKPNNELIIINVRQSPTKVAEQISSCEYIASSSLHGLIFADSFRIPNIHLKFGNRLFGGLHKFNDYYSGMNALGSHLDYSSILTINDIIAHCELKYTTDYLIEKQEKMIKRLSETLLNSSKFK